MIHHGDCLEVMAGMESASVDAVCTDPPYGLGFMGKAWDHGAPGVPFWREMFRVARPSSYLLAFGGTRTVHRIATAIEDAGWIIRDMLVWAYASGFPKSKASLKPAWEPIVMARKSGPLRMLAIDACRIPMEPEDAEATMASMSGARNFRRVDAGSVTGLPTEPDGGYVLPAGDNGPRLRARRLPLDRHRERGGVRRHRASTAERHTTRTWVSRMIRPCFTLEEDVRP